MASASALHRHTPVLAVRDARDLPLRQVAWCRVAAEQAVARRVTLMRHDGASQECRQWDPRLFEALQQDGAVASNQRNLASLSGRPLLTESTDSGWQLVLPGDAGQAAESWDTRGSHWRTLFDERLRPLRIEESAAGQATRVSTGFTYATEAGLNRRGRLVRQDDDAGSRLIDGYDLTGQVRGETRHFLAALDLPDWPDAVLEPGDGASTLFIHGPLQELLSRTDAMGNRQCYRFNLGGELTHLLLQLEDGTQHTLLSDARYNAFGKIESQVAGNGVINHREYEPASGRLSRLSASRPGRSTLQDLLYDYDPVGNVVKIEDLDQPVRHFANQRIDPVNTFRYDTLYQLIEATGREALGALIGPQLPELAPNPGDTGNLLNYRQHYEYDASGNLFSLKHVGQQSYTRALTVADHGNHTVPSPGDPLTAFDPNGNLLDLDAGQPLHWNARNQLHGTRQVAREDGADDEEHYRYGGDGLRVRKVATRRVAGRMQSRETRYLPGLELHSRPGESYAVITAQAGCCAVRCLYWNEGQPEGIANPQLRYSLDDPLGSSSLELDGAARIISHEGYYPFGGSAWWAARSSVEAGYKTRRYSGKARDDSGLYDYGLRYYAPWLMRWISADPAGTRDGLNLFRAMHNNPVSWSDPDGLTPEPGQPSESLETLPLPDPTEVTNAERQVATQTMREAIYSLPYRDIPSDSPFSKGFSYIEVELGDDFFIYMDTRSKADNLIITAHGQYFPWDKDFPIPDGVSMTYFNPHGTWLDAPDLSTLVTGTNKAFVELQGQSVIPRKEKALALLDQGRVDKLSGSRKPGFMTNYRLLNFSKDHLAELIRTLNISRANDPDRKFDVATVRSRIGARKPLSIPSLKGMFRALENRGIQYGAVYGSFCRGNLLRMDRLTKFYDPVKAANL